MSEADDDVWTMITLVLGGVAIEELNEVVI